MELSAKHLGESVTYTFNRISRQGGITPERRKAVIKSMNVSINDEYPNFYRLSDGMLLGDKKAFAKTNINTSIMVDILTMSY